jgi:hypothetical protein
MENAEAGSSFQAAAIGTSKPARGASQHAPQYVIRRGAGTAKLSPLETATA